jgi:hypothetical protein
MTTEPIKLTEQKEIPDRMRVVNYQKIADYTYQIETESAKHGRVTQKVLVFPTSTPIPKAITSELKEG